MRSQYISWLVNILLEVSKTDAQYLVLDYTEKDPTIKHSGVDFLSKNRYRKIKNPKKFRFDFPDWVTVEKVLSDLGFVFTNDPVSSDAIHRTIVVHYGREFVMYMYVSFP